MNDTLKRLEKIERQIGIGDDADMLDCRIKFYDIEPHGTLKRQPNPVMPRSAIMMAKSLKLNLKLVYQLTLRMMICPSKCRPLNNPSTPANPCILSSSPDRALFAPEPP